MRLDTFPSVFSRRVVLGCWSAIAFLAFAALRAATPSAVIAIDEPATYKTNTTYFPDIGISLTRGYAPFPVFFEGWQSTTREELVRYEWDFGAGTETDEMGRTFEGFNAAHVFETPGTYTVVLKVTNAAGETSAASVTITVMSRDTRTTYYVDSVLGNDSNDGRSPTIGAGHGPWRTATKALGTLKRGNGGVTLAPGDRVLFNRGQTFVLDGAISSADVPYLVSLGHGQACQGIQYGAYGTGPKPRIQWSGTGAGVLFSVNWGGAYLVMSDLDFNFWNSANGSQLNGILFAYAAWKNVLFLRDDFHEPGNGVWTIPGLDPKPAGIFTVSCTADNHQTYSTSVTQLFGSVSRLALLNNKFDQAGNHICYLETVDKGVIAGNVFSRPAFGRTAIRITGGPAGATGNNIVVSDNRFLGWVDPINNPAGAHNGGGRRYYYLLVHFGPNGDGQQLIDNVVFERNVVTNFEVGLSIDNAANMVVRNNLFVAPAAGTGLSLNQSSALGWGYRPLTNVLVQGNTFISGSYWLDPSSTGDAYPLLRMRPYSGPSTFGGADTNVQVVDNLFATSAQGKAPGAIELTAAVPGFTSAHNLFHFPNLAGGPFLRFAGVARLLADWRSATGNDAASLVGDPEFEGGAISELNSGAPGVPASLAAGEAEAAQLISAVRLTAGSPAVDAGANFGVWLAFDFLRQARPVDGDGDGTSTTDIGAFEFVGVVPATYATWRAAHFTGAELSDDAISGPQADPDGSGLVNYARYAFDLSPRGPVAAPIAVGSVVSGGVTYAMLTFARRTAGSDLSYTVEASTDLVTWTPLATHAPGIPAAVTVRDSVAMSAAPRHFLRVRITAP